MESKYKFEIGDVVYLNSFLGLEMTVIGNGYTPEGIRVTCLWFRSGEQSGFFRESFPEAALTLKKGVSK